MRFLFLSTILLDALISAAQLPMAPNVVYHRQVVEDGVAHLWQEVLFTGNIDSLATRLYRSHHRAPVQMSQPIHVQDSVVFSGLHHPMWFYMAFQVEMQVLETSKKGTLLQFQYDYSMPASAEVNSSRRKRKLEKARREAYHFPYEGHFLARAHLQEQVNSLINSDFTQDGLVQNGWWFLRQFEDSVAVDSVIHSRAFQEREEAMHLANKLVAQLANESHDVPQLEPLVNGFEAKPCNWLAMEWEQVYRIRAEVVEVDSGSFEVQVQLMNWIVNKQTGELRQSKPLLEYWPHFARQLKALEEA